MGKGVRQGCILSPYLLYAESIMREAGLEEERAGNKIAGMTINNQRYADDATLIAENAEDLEKLIKRVKTHSAQTGLYLNIKKTKVMTTDNVDEFKADGEKVEVVQSFNFLGSHIFKNGETSEEIKRRLSMARTARCMDVKVEQSKSKIGDGLMLSNCGAGGEC
ncbi:uncharacterized protein LOC134778895 [Penaeus indicus]|uniref:uncharacterized protein LOC134778895 n=1 Tax=Penaeus indicus TaxID=29960 RepID=UPI00300D7722